MLVYHGVLAAPLVDLLPAGQASKNLVSFRLSRVVAFRFPYECREGDTVTFIVQPEDLNLARTLYTGKICTKVLVYVIRGIFGYNETENDGAALFELWGGQEWATAFRACLTASPFEGRELVFERSTVKIEPAEPARAPEEFVII